MEKSESTIEQFPLEALKQWQIDLEMWFKGYNKITLTSELNDRIGYAKSSTAHDSTNYEYLVNKEIQSKVHAEVLRRESVFKKIEFKNGDIVECDDFIFIFKEIKYNRVMSLLSVNKSSGRIYYKDNGIFTDIEHFNECIKTLSTIEALNAELAKHDLIGDAEKKEAVKLVWFPKDDETYYYPTFAPNSECMSAKTHNDGTNLDSSIIKLGLAFKTAKEATACANRMLNAAHNA